MPELVLEPAARAAVVRMARREAAVLGLVPAASDRVEWPEPEVEIVARDCPECGAGFASAVARRGGGAPIKSAVVVPASSGSGLPTVEMLGCEELTARSLLMVAVQAATDAAGRFVTRSVAWHDAAEEVADGSRLVRLDRREAAGHRDGTTILPVATRRAAEPETARIHAAHIVSTHSPSRVLTDANNLYRAARTSAVSHVLNRAPHTFVSGGGSNESA